MTPSDSLPPNDDELLSAYLDGELSEHEQAEVEQRLSTDAEARRLLEELRSLGATLQSLPAEHPAPGLRERIDARIEQAQPTLPTLPRDDRHSLNLRRWSWAAVALAAALLMALLLPPQEADEVAGVGEAKRRVGHPPRSLEDEAGPQLFAADPASESEPAPSADAREASDAAPIDAAPPDAFGDLAMQQRRKSRPAPADATMAPMAASPESIDVAAGGGLGGLNSGVPVVRLTYTSESAFADFRRVLDTNEVELQQPERQVALQAPLQRVLDSTIAEANASSVDEAVLIEAPPRQIEQILLDCYLNEGAFAAVELPGRVGGFAGRYFAVPEARWSQYARGGREQLVEGYGYDLAKSAEPGRRSQNGDQQLQMEMTREDQTSTDLVGRGAARQSVPEQGRAVRLRLEPADPDESAGASPEAEFSEAFSMAANELDEVAGPEQPMQMLFLLQSPKQR